MARQIGADLFFTVAEAAAQLGCSSIKLQAYIRQGRLPTIRQGQAQLIREQDVQALHAKRFL